MHPRDLSMMQAPQAPLPDPAAVALSVRRLVKAYGGVRAVDSLDLVVRTGEIHSVIGPNGAGKSTLFKLLMGTERPTSGVVMLGDQDVTSLPAFRRARLGLAAKFQNVPIYQELTVAQNLFVPLHRKFAGPDIPGETELALARVHLAGTQELPARSLSHGQQQWLSIAMALAARPRVLLLDEPTAGMSMEESRDTGVIVKSLNATGVTVLVIEHDMAFVRQLESTVSVMHYGMLVAQGTMDDIERDPEVRRIYRGSGDT